MDKVFYNGIVRTLDDNNNTAEAVGIKDGKIAFVGTNEEARSIECDNKVNLKGRLLLPGFVDSHMHMLHYAFVEKSVKLFDCKSVEECLQLAKNRLEENVEKPLTWLFCRGWNHENFDEPRYLQQPWSGITETDSSVP